MHRLPASALAVFLLVPACESGAQKGPEAAAAKKAADNKQTDKKEPGAKAADDGATSEKKPSDAAMLARGKYLAEVVMNCQACHTPAGENGPELDKAYAGGLEFPDAQGTWRSPNITQDKDTGIGGWTDEQIITAVREGKRPTGEQLYAFMPYEYFRIASDEDMAALVAFLRTVKPIKNPIPQLSGLEVKKPKHRPAAPQPPGTEPMELGRYLVGLAHCGGCHTPLNDDGSPDESKLLSGGVKFTALPFQGSGEVWSANLTPHEKTGIGKYSDEELVRAIVDLDKRDGTAIVGPMTFYVRAWSELKHKDVEAIVAYLRSIPAVDNAVPESTWKPPKP